MMVLYHFTLCPFSRMVRIFLHEKKLNFSQIEENPWKKRKEFINNINITGQVPVVVDHPHKIADSMAICEYVEEAYESKGLFGNSCKARADVRRLVYWINYKFYHEVTRYIINEKISRYYSDNMSPDSRFIRAAKQNLPYHIKYMESLIHQNGRLVSSEISLADIALASHISVLDYTNDFPWNISNIVKEWYSLIKSRPCFQEILADRLIGFVPPAHYSCVDF